MGYFNRVILLGNVTREPETKYSSDTGRAISKFGIAINRRYKMNNSIKEETCFVDIIAFGKSAEFCDKFLKKGYPVLVEGRLSQKVWEIDGVRKSKHEVVALNIQLVEKRKQNGSLNEYETHGVSDTSINDNEIDDDYIDDDDIPF